MADTSFIKRKVEPFVRKQLSKLFDQRFEEKKLHIGVKGDATPRMHSFDAVSEDSKIVAAIKSSTGLTSGGNIPAAKLDGVYKDLYFLSLVKAQSKILVLTDPEFHDMFNKDCDGILPPQTVLLHIPLSEALQSEVSNLKGRTD